MAIIPITKEHIDQVTLEMHPKRMFSSSSITGQITGSVYVFANRSPLHRQRIESSPFTTNAVDPDTTDENLLLNEVSFDASSYESCWDELVASNPAVTTATSTDIERDRSYAYEEYLNKVNNQAKSPELNKFMEIWRFKPSFSFTSNTLRKNIVKDILFPYYAGVYGTQFDWGYSNYNCLTFFTASEVTPNSALVYPAPSAGLTNNQYINTSSFSISFWINPRRTTTNDQADYRAGTLLHLSSSFAVSLVSGSEKDDYGNPEAFRILLQLSQSADLAPSKVDLSIANNARSWPNDMIYLSPDNSLKLNNWHNVTICWGSNHNYGTGSIWVDNNEDTRVDFSVPSSSLNNSHLTRFVPLLVGNYYDADNEGVTPPMTKFFNQAAANNEGVQYHGAAIGQEIDPAKLTHKPNADAHEIRIYDKYLTANERITGSQSGPSDLSNLLFYLPPFFTKESLSRDVLTTPYFTKKTATETPFNVDLSFGVGGHDLNIENFTRDFANGIYPRNYCLTASVVTADVLWATANQINWNRGDNLSFWRARQLLFLPNDNGNFYPNFGLLSSGTISDPPVSGSATDMFVDDWGNLDYSLITLRNMVSTASADALSIQSQPGVDDESNPDSDAVTGGDFTILQQVLGGNTYNPDFMTAGDEPETSYELTVIERTKDNSSNELYFFDASNLFYGNRIQPGSFEIKDISLTGSAGAVSMRIKDDLMGNLYRADSLSPHAKWSSVGNILYDEGIAVIKSPNIPLYGQDQFEINFTGLHNVHTYEVNVILSPNLFTSSSNPSFLGGKPDDYASTIDNNFVAFSSILLHDDNMNIITRSNLAQPIIKKLGDKYLVRIKIDY
tara:strand:+ start:15964 stop:18492 length:2529 start_codon:yes stop_codon:yes gene_type:complete